VHPVQQLHNLPRAAARPWAAPPTPKTWPCAASTIVHTNTCYINECASPASSGPAHPSSGGHTPCGWQLQLQRWALMLLRRATCQAEPGLTQLHLGATRWMPRAWRVRQVHCHHHQTLRYSHPQVTAGLQARCQHLCFWHHHLRHCWNWQQPGEGWPGQHAEWEGRPLLQNPPEAAVKTGE
jgi:hypothetical protein